MAPGDWRATRRARGRAPAVEAAVFALIGLLIAFTFTGAASRFNARRHLIVQETNAKSVEGSPQMTAALSDWNLAPSFAADYFTFNPPPTARKIKFLEAAPAVRPAKAVK